MLPTHASQLFDSLSPVAHGSCAHDPIAYGRRGLSGVEKLSAICSCRCAPRSQAAALVTTTRTAIRTFIGRLRNEVHSAPRPVYDPDRPMPSLFLIDYDTLQNTLCRYDLQR